VVPDPTAVRLIISPVRASAFVAATWNLFSAVLTANTVCGSVVPPPTPGLEPSIAMGVASDVYCSCSPVTKK